MLLNYIQSMCPVLVSTCWSSAVTVAVWRRRARAGGRASATAAGRWAEGAALAIKGVLLFSGSIRTRLALASALWPPTESATRARPAASYCRPITTATRPTTTKHISNSNNSCNGPITRPAAEISSRREMQLPDGEEGVALRATAARPACNVAASRRRRRVAPPAALITTGPRSKFHLNNNNYWIVIECLRFFWRRPQKFVFRANFSNPLLHQQQQPLPSGGQSPTSITQSGGNGTAESHIWNTAAAAISWMVDGGRRSLLVIAPSRTRERRRRTKEICHRHLPEFKKFF